MFSSDVLYSYSRSNYDQLNLYFGMLKKLERNQVKLDLFAAGPQKAVASLLIITDGHLYLCWIDTHRHLLRSITWILAFSGWTSFLQGDLRYPGRTLESFSPATQHWLGKGPSFLENIRWLFMLWLRRWCHQEMFVRCIGGTGSHKTQ